MCVLIVRVTYDHSNESYLAVLSCGAVCRTVGVVLIFHSVDEKSSRETIQMKATEQYFPVVLFIRLYKMVLTFVSVDKTLKCDHSNESY